MVFENSRPLSQNNLATGGTSSYDIAPTGTADFNSLKENIPFTQGHLTNRQTALVDRDTKGSRIPSQLEKWIVSWKDAAPTALTFDLKKPYPLDHLTLFYSGTLPALETQTSLDGKTWQGQSSVAAKAVTADVLTLELPLQGTHRYVRLKIAERKAEEEFKLAETEIWGGNPQ